MFFDVCSCRFGKVVSLSKEEFLHAIDQEDPAVTVIVHIYESVCEHF